jgi:hypothetical protein
MLELEVYFDDSGTHDRSNTALAACYISTKKQWDNFNRNWKETLDDEGLEYFHTGDYFTAKQQPSCDWDGTNGSESYLG